MATSLSLRGEELARQVGRTTPHAAEEEFVLVSAFDGIGGARVAWHLKGLAPAVAIGIEIDKESIRVASVAWPDTVHLGDIRKLTEEDFHPIHQEAPRAKRGLVVGRFPCQGMSGLNALRKGLADPRSNLFYGI